MDISLPSNSFYAQDSILCNKLTTMSSPQELTTITRMRRDFEAFIGEHHSNKSGNPRKRKSLKCTLDFDETLTECDINDENVAFCSKRAHEKLQEAERLADKSDIAQLKTQIVNLEAKLERERIEAEKLLSVEKHEKEQCLEKISELKMKLKLLCQKENQLQEDNKEMSDRLTNIESKMTQVRKEKTDAECKQQKAKLENEQEATKLMEKLFQVQTAYKRCQSQLEEAHNETSTLKNKLSKTQDQVKELEPYKNKANLSEQLVKDLELKVQRLADDSIIMKNMKSQLSRMPELEKEVDILRTHNINLRDNQEMTAVLKEKLESCQKKLARYEQQLSQYCSMEVEFEEVKKKLKEWQTLDGSSIYNPLTPSAVKKKLLDLQNSEAIFLEKDGKLKTLIHTQGNEIKRLQNQVQKLQSNLENEGTANRHYNDVIKSLNKRCIRLEKERDGYKQIIASYDNDLTIMSSESMARSRIQALEEMVKNLRSSLESNEAELDRVKEQLLHTNTQKLDLQQLPCTYSKPTVTVLDQKIELQLRQKIEELEKQLENVIEEKNVLEMRIEQRNLQGDYDPRKTKVLHMKMNPASSNQQLRQEKMSKLEAEVERLRARVKVLEDSGSQSVDITLQVDQKLQESCNCKEVIELRSQLESAELKIKRLLQTFKETSQEVREMTYRLTGYRLDITSTDVYKLTNIYAASADDYLIFKRGSSGEMQLLESNFSKMTKELMDVYLQRQHSIPAYLSSITLDLLNQQ